MCIVWAGRRDAEQVAHPTTSPSGFGHGIATNNMALRTDSNRQLVFAKRGWVWSQGDKGQNLVKALGGGCGQWVEGKLVAGSGFLIFRNPFSTPKRNCDTLLKKKEPGDCCVHFSSHTVAWGHPDTTSRRRKSQRQSGRSHAWFLAWDFPFG